jgi:hypothetical protein
MYEHILNTEDYFKITKKKNYTHVDVSNTGPARIWSGLTIWRNPVGFQHYGFVSHSTTRIR